MIPFSESDIHSHETRAEKDVLVIDEKFYDQILQGQKLLEQVSKYLKTDEAQDIMKLSAHGYPRLQELLAGVKN